MPHKVSSTERMPTSPLELGGRQKDISLDGSTLITTRTIEGQTLSLCEGCSGNYFVLKTGKGVEHSTPVTPALAAIILQRETRRHMAKIFRRKLQARSAGRIAGRRFDTTADELLWIDCDDNVEGAAAYRTSSGVEYLRLVNAQRDLVLLFETSEWEDIQESVEMWLACDRSFTNLVDWSYIHEVSTMTGVSANEEALDPAVWPPSGSDEKNVSEG